MKAFFLPVDGGLTVFRSLRNVLSLPSQALNRLHQLKVLGHTLVVEFAREHESVTVLKDPPVTNEYVRYFFAPQHHTQCICIISTLWKKAGKLY